MGLLRSDLTSLRLDFRDLQAALDQVEGTAPTPLHPGARSPRPDELISLFPRKHEGSPGLIGRS